jgi:hypothetical protein
MAVIVLDTFNGTDGSSPSGALIMNAAGDLFGMTTDGGADGLGEVFEITDTNGSYASTPTVLSSFTGADGAAFPSFSMAAAGDLFASARKGTRVP